jgi:hypothetical protein
MGHASVVDRRVLSVAEFKKLVEAS